MNRLGRQLVSVAAILAAAIPAVGQAQPAAGVTDGLSVMPAFATSTAAPSRDALIITSSFAAGARDAIAQSEAKPYRDLLPLLGFRVTLVVAPTRLDIDLAVRAFAQTIGADTEVAVFILGTVLPKGDDLYVFAGETSSLPRLDVYETEGLRLADITKRVASASPKELVLFVDECRPVAGQACRFGSGTVPDSVSGIMSLPASQNAAGAPFAALGSLRSDMPPLMRQENLSYFALFGALKNRIARTNLTIASTSSLTRTFAFLPSGFLAGLPLACNRVDADADAAALRSGPPLASLISDCEDAARIYDFSPWFKDKLTLVREQVAFQQAAMGCDRADAIRAYLDDYPQGRFRANVTSIEAACDAERAASAPTPQVAAETPPPEPPPLEPPPAPPPEPRTPPSFDCSRAAQPAEVAICADDELAKLDAALGSAYKARLSSLQGSARRAFVMSERAWIADRNRCGHDRICLIGLLAARLRALSVY